MPDLDHLLVQGATEAQDFRSPLSVRSRPLPDRDRGAHGSRLLAQLQALDADVARLQVLRANRGIAEDSGFAISLEVSPPGALDPGKKLEWKRDGIEVLSVVTSNTIEIINVHVPSGKLSAFEKRVREYLTQETKPKKEGDQPKPKHARLINAITSIQRAAFEQLWTDIAPSPEREQPFVFQIWLRLGRETARDAYAAFRDAAERLNIAVEAGFLTFPGRVVVAVHATRALLEDAIGLLDMIAEVRRTSVRSDLFDLRPFEQVEWVRDLVGRIVPPIGANTPRVALLDTGVNRGHPLLVPFLDPADMHAVIAAWDTIDRNGHGTGMAGLALHGDLSIPLASQDLHLVPHRLESVKILPDVGQNSPHLYGWTADESVRLIEQAGAGVQRSFSMMTTANGATAGWPSEWSATIDRLAFGLQGANVDTLDLPPIGVGEMQIQPRLFTLAAGNIPWQDWTGYPDSNDIQSIEDPGQAWNALTVGSITHRVEFDEERWPDLRPIAMRGALAPSSRTSLLWEDRWPIKPDVVAEGGNGCIDRATERQVTVGPEDLRLVTTSHNPTKVMLAESGDTSAATAEVARICAHLQARYPGYWPETIRALVVQGAGYTAHMRNGLKPGATQRDRRAVLRRYGHGVASLESSLNSTLRRPTLILQETIVPYVTQGNARRLGQVNIHRLPWPSASLETLGEASIALKVTLSYFIQPNPSRRGWQSKFRYSSHGLRFAVQGSREEDERFLQRINRIKRDEMGDDREDSMPDPDGDGWLIGRSLRSQGSIHSDTWYGTASELAHKSGVAVFPVGGWWKELPVSNHPDRRVRYTLVISLEVLSDLDVDIYTPIANQIAVPVVGG